MESSGRNITVLLYHRVIKKTDIRGKHHIYVYDTNFRRQMQFLKKAGYESVTFEDIYYHRIKETDRPKVIITFDDGYEDNYHVAFPILMEFGFRAVIFLVTGMKRNEWGIKEGEPELHLLNAEMIREMIVNGFEFGGHSRNHCDGTKLTKMQKQTEIEGSKSDLENKFGKTMISYSYPYGAVDQSSKEIAANCNIIYAVATNSGPRHLFDDKLHIRRKEVHLRTTLCSFKRKVGAASSINRFFNIFEKP